jgi:predicted aspartyl protease
LVLICSIGSLHAASAARAANAYPQLDTFLKSAGYAAVPLRGNRQRLVAHAPVNGTNRMFLVDTGWSVSSIDDRAIGQLPNVVASGTTLRDPIFRTLNPETVTVLDKLKLGSFEFFDVPFVLKRGLSEPAVLGGDFLIRRFSLLDCATSRLYLRESALADRGRLELAELLRQRGFLAHPLQATGLFVVSCQVGINGEPVKLLVDTGAAATVLDRGIIDLLGIPRTEKRNRAIRGVGRIGSAWLYSARLDSLQIGAMLMTNVHVGVADLSRWGLADERARFKDVKGLLGLDLLRANRAVIDYTNGKLHLFHSPAVSR